MTRIQNRDLKRLETRNKPKKSEIGKNLKNVKKRQNKPVKKENSDIKEIKNVGKQEETLSDAASERSSVINSGKDKF
jgi:hypothetical protein